MLELDEMWVFLEVGGSRPCQQGEMRVKFRTGDAMRERSSRMEGSFHHLC